MKNFTVQYHIERSGDNGGCAILRGVVSADRPSASFAVGTLEVDGIELIPSSRLHFHAGRSSAELPEVRIYRPVAGRNYLFHLILNLPDGSVELDEVVLL
ncbi:MAG: hypothetical protein PHI85_11050 [Victivallaceae bacterium]|nr:hypothetical protein [Victivallaceae bacterium]